MSLLRTRRVGPKDAAASLQVGGSEPVQWVANVAGTVRLSVEGPKPTWTENAVEYGTVHSCVA